LHINGQTLFGMHGIGQCVDLLYSVFKMFLELDIDAIEYVNPVIFYFNFVYVPSVISV